MGVWLKDQSPMGSRFPAEGGETQRASHLLLFMMDEDWHIRHLADEQEKMESEGRAIRGCGLLALAVAVLAALICMFF